MGEPDPNAALGGTLADAQAAMRKGRAGSLWMIGALGLTVAAALVVLVGGDDEARAYGEIGKRVNGIKRAQFDQFWACALQNENVADIRSNTELSEKLDGRGHERGRRYGVHLRDRCMPKLEKIEPELELLIAPADLRSELAALSEACGRLRGALSGYVAYLDDPALAYDASLAKPHIDGIVRAWYDFKATHKAVNTKVKGKLQR
jgi:hypothetical protein